MMKTKEKTRDDVLSIIERIEKHNNWRRGDDSEPMASAKMLGDDLTFSVEFMRAALDDQMKVVHMSRRPEDMLRTLQYGTDIHHANIRLLAEVNRLNAEKNKLRRTITALGLYLVCRTAFDLIVMFS